MGIPVLERVKKYNNTIIEKRCIECGSFFKERRLLVGVCNECKEDRKLRLRPQTFKICEICGNKFGPVDKLSIRFCSRQCGYKGRKSGQTKGKHYENMQRARIGKCLICSKKYRAINDHKHRKQKFCSEKCFWIFWKKEVRPKIELPPTPTGDKSHAWKGDDVGYSGVHKWVASKLGVAAKCDHCGSEKKKKYEWANIDHKYCRNIDDYMRLCTSCHRKYDYLSFR